MYERNAVSTSLVEMSLSGVGTVLRLEGDPWPMVKRLRQATNEYVPPSLHTSLVRRPLYPVPRALLHQEDGITIADLSFDMVPQSPIHIDHVDRRTW